MKTKLGKNYKSKKLEKLENVTTKSFQLCNSYPDLMLKTTKVLNQN